MRHSPGYYNRLLLMLVASDLGRGAFSLLVLGLLYLADFPLWLILVAPILIYFGLWLLTSTTHPGRLRPPDKMGDYTACLEIRQRLVIYAQQVSDERTSHLLQGITAQLDRILGVIEEDKKFDSTTPLLSLLGITDDLLEKYAKVSRRGFDDVRTREAVRESLETLSVSYQDFWGHLNRYVIVDLDALTQMIRELLQRLASPQDDSGVEAEPREQGSEPATLEVSQQEKVLGSGAPSDGDGKWELLTRREMEVLCLLAKPMMNRQISEELFIDTRTVEKHVATIFGKLEVQSRTAAALYALKHGVCQDADSNGASDSAAKSLQPPTT